MTSFQCSHIQAIPTASFVVLFILVQHPDIGSTVSVAVVLLWSECIDHVRSRVPLSHAGPIHVAGPTIWTESRAATVNLNRMWVITGPFDGDVSNEVGFQSNAFSSLTTCQTHPRYVLESKLLKSGKSYLIGRKSTCDLVVNHKKVSHDHGRFEVGGFSPDDVVRTPFLLCHARVSYPWLQTNVNYMPTLRILNSKNKTMRIWREGVANGIIVNPSATESLQHNDKVDIVSGLPLLYVYASTPFPIYAII